MQNTPGTEREQKKKKHLHSEILETNKHICQSQFLLLPLFDAGWREVISTQYKDQILYEHKEYAYWSMLKHTK